MHRLEQFTFGFRAGFELLAEEVFETAPGVCTVFAQTFLQLLRIRGGVDVGVIQVIGPTRAGVCPGGLAEAQARQDG